MKSKQKRDQKEAPPRNHTALTLRRWLATAGCISWPSSVALAPPRQPAAARSYCRGHPELALQTSTFRVRRYQQEGKSSAYKPAPPEPPSAYIYICLDPHGPFRQILGVFLVFLANRLQRPPSPSSTRERNLAQSFNLPPSGYQSFQQSLKPYVDYPVSERSVYSQCDRVAPPKR